MQIKETTNNMDILKNKATYNWVLESKKQLETGSYSVHELIRMEKGVPEHK